MSRSFSSTPLRGSALLATILLTILVGVIAAGIISTTVQEMKINERHMLRMRAQAAANAALEERIGLLNRASAEGIPFATNAQLNDVAALYRRPTLVADLNALTAINNVGVAINFANFGSLAQYASTWDNLERLEVTAAYVRRNEMVRVNPNDPANFMDPYQGQTIRQNRIMIVARATARSPRANGPSVTASASTIYLDRNSAFFNYAIFFHDPINWLIGENTAIRGGPVHSNSGISVGGWGGTYKIFGNMTTAGYLVNNQIQNLNSQGGSAPGTFLFRRGSDDITALEDGQSPRTQKWQAFAEGGVFPIGTSYTNRVGGLFIPIPSNGINKTLNSGGVQITPTVTLNPNFAADLLSRYQGNVLTGANGVTPKIPRAFEEIDPSTGEATLKDMSLLLDPSIRNPATVPLPAGISSRETLISREIQKYSNRATMVIVPDALNLSDPSVFIYRPATAADPAATERFIRPMPGNPAIADTVLYVREDVTAIVNGTTAGVPSIVTRPRLTRGAMTILIDTTAAEARDTIKHTGGSANTKIHILNNARLIRDAATNNADPTTATFWDGRRQRWVSTVDVNVGNLATFVTQANIAGTPAAIALAARGITPDRAWNGTVHVEAAGAALTAPDASLGTPASFNNYTYANSSQLGYAVRLTNASAVPNRTITDPSNAALTRAEGFTVTTNLPIYTIGNFNANTTDTADSVNVPNVGGYPNNVTSRGNADLRGVPASIIGDSVTILSANWADNLSLRNNRAGGRSVPGANVMISAAIVTGNVVAGYRGSGEGDGHTANFPRYNQNWGGRNITIRGGIMQLFRSRIANSPHQHNAGGVTYAAPSNVNIGLSSLFTAGIYPPEAPETRVSRRTEYMRLTDAQFTGLVGTRNALTGVGTGSLFSVAP